MVTPLPHSRRLVRALAAALLLPLAQCGEGAEDVLAPPFSIASGARELRVGESVQLSASGAAGAVTWSSTDPAVATVEFGLVRAVGSGTVVIVAASGEEVAQAAFTVTRPPLLSLPEAAATFAATAGGPPPAARALAIENAGDHPVEGLAVGAITYSAGASGWLAAGVAPATAPATLTLQPATTALAAGTYTATVPVASTTAVNSPATVAVTYLVAPAPDPLTIALSPGVHAFAAFAGGALPGALTVSVASGGVGTLTGLATSVEYVGGATGWLTVTQPSPTTAPAAFTVQPNATSLPAGTYTANVRVTSPVASNSPQTLVVTYTVQVLRLADIWPILDTATVRTSTGAVLGCKTCHTGGTSATGVPRLDLTMPAGFRASAVGQPAVLPVCGAMPKVDPGSPATSCLRLMIESPAAHLDRRIGIVDDPAALQRLYEWIRQGALP